MGKRTESNIAIKIGDKYEIKRDNYQWVVVKFSRSTNDKGKEVVTERRTFYPKLEQVARQILHEYPSEAKQINHLAEDFYMCAQEIE